MFSILHYELHIWRYEASKGGREFLDTLYIKFKELVTAGTVIKNFDNRDIERSQN